MEFKDKLKKLRNDKGVSQYDLADALNISRSVVAKWETGLTLPSEESLARLSSYFNISKDELIMNLEHEQVITSKNIKISKFQKIIYSLTGALVLVVVAIIVIASIGFKDSEQGGNVPSTNNDIQYTLVVNNDDIIPFEPTVLKPENESIENIVNSFSLNASLDRKDTIHIYKDGTQLTNVTISWSGMYGVTEPTGGYYLYEEGVYDIILIERYYESILTSIQITLERVDSIYQDVKIYFVDNNKQPLSMTQITKETDTPFSELLFDWYIQDVELEVGDRIYFFSTLEVSNKSKQIIGFKNDTIFEEIYDEEFNGYYIEVKETHKFNYLLLKNDGAFMDIMWEYEN